MKWVLGILLTGLCMSAVAKPDGNLLSVLDTGANPRLFDVYFGRYGTKPAQVVIKESTGLRFRLPANSKGSKPTGLYSYFALAGDFEVSANYVVLELPAPTAGYGTGFGMAVETKGPDGDVTVRRGRWEKEGSGIQVVRGRPDSAGVMKYEAKFFPTTSTKGSIILRREKGEIVVLTTSPVTKQPYELHRLPFTEKTIRTLLLFADSGGSATVVDGRLNGITIRAAEITGGIPEGELGETPTWVIVLAILSGVILGISSWAFLSKRKKTYS